MTKLMTPPKVDTTADIALSIGDPCEIHRDGQPCYERATWRAVVTCVCKEVRRRTACDVDYESLRGGSVNCYLDRSHKVRVVEAVRI